MDYYFKSRDVSGPIRELGNMLFFSKVNDHSKLQNEKLLMHIYNCTHGLASQAAESLDRGVIKP